MEQPTIGTANRYGDYLKSEEPAPDNVAFADKDAGKQIGEVVPEELQELTQSQVAHVRMAQQGLEPVPAQRIVAMDEEGTGTGVSSASQTTKGTNSASEARRMQELGGLMSSIAATVKQSAEKLQEAVKNTVPGFRAEDRSAK